MITFFKRSLSFQMLIAALAGIVIGLFLGDLCSVFAPWENAYIMILKITTIPYLICAVMHGIGRLGYSAAKNILRKGLLFISCMWMVNIIFIYMTVYLFPKTQGITFSAFSNIQPSSINFAELIIPANIFSALSSNVIPAVVVFGLLIGISLMHLKDKQPFMGVLDTLVDSLTKITGWISRITPLGTFLIIADRVGTMQLTTVKQIGTYLILYIIGISILVFWVVPRIVGMLTVIPAKHWLKSLSPLMIVAFTTNLVIVTLPFLIELIKREVAHFYHKEETRHDDSMGDQIQGIVTVIFNLPLGSIFIAVFIFFVSTFYHIPLSGESQLQLFMTTFLTSLGAIGLGSWINSLNFLLDTLGLPLTAVDTYLATLPFTAGFQSLVSVMEVASLSLVIALSCHGLLKWDWKKISKQTFMILIPIFAFIAVFKNWIHLPPIANPTKGIYEMSIAQPIKVKVYGKNDPVPSPRSGEPLDRILSTRVLRVGYNIESIPFCFPNVQGELVGYDMAFAYTLAKDLGCNLELIPIKLSHFTEELNQGLYDIAMSSVTINEDRLRKIAFSKPYLESRIAFLMKKKYKKMYTSLTSIIQDPRVRLVVKRGTAYEKLAKSLFPESKIVIINSYNDYLEDYPNDILLRGEYQQISWSLFHPDYTVVIPEPQIAKDIFGYATAQGADKLLCYLNLWLDLKKTENLTEQQFNVWVLGQTDITTAPTRRWSIIRDVFGWSEN
ncbi:MAG: cation:dicarboxylase symporter family transporter [Rhabdochlamydiaceae bacterium]|nr:cation:dicarboxylase symporter family transporter [Rhabdochlamydiaceae bacterium]